MKLFIFFLTIFLTTGLLESSFASDTTKYRVTSYTYDGVELEDLALAENVQLLLFTDPENNPVFENHFINKNSYSSGKIYDFKYEDIPESDSTFASQNITFLWNYFNSYDSDRGSALVSIDFFFTDGLTKFNCKILGVNKNFELIMSGYQLK
ncbi:hypothetical protein ACS126_16400 [Sphingobacterium lactis]|uniref:hypothetical protein n=1 Tax=Sphingobacterium lactis TaxID=797291 RepID=UPI003EC908EC